MQHFKFVNWRIRGFVFLMSRTGYYLKQKVSLLVSTFCDQDGRQEGFLCNWLRFLDGNFVQPSRSWLWH